MGKIVYGLSGASERRIEANRKNAQRSCGPKTPHGKAASSRNAVAHGLTARSILLAGENPDDFLRLRSEAFAELKPRGVLESELADQIVDTLWRSRRIPLFERALIASLEQTVRSDSFPQVELGASLFAGLDASRNPEQARDIRLGRVIQKFLNGNFVGKLSRYETNLQRQLSRLLTDLHKLKRQAEIEIEMRPAPFGSRAPGCGSAR